MGIRNCARCGRIFNSVTGRPICEVCRKELEEMYQKVKTFIKENPNHNIKEVSEECEVPEWQIKQWVREERLQFSRESKALLCERCGQPITTGRFCNSCKTDMANAINDAMKPASEEKQEAASEAIRRARLEKEQGMRFLKNKPIQ